VTSHRDQVEEVRQRAVDLHDGQATLFESWYGQKQTKNHYASAFLYGRKKVDDLLYRWLKSLPETGKVLDVGCGTGEQIRLVRELGYEVGGVEPAPAMRQKAMTNNPGSVILDGSVTAIPFNDDSFDGVVCIEVLRYLHHDDITKAYEEMFRVLRPGGRMFVTLVNLLAIDGFFVFDRLKRIAHRLSFGTEPAHCEFMTPRRVRRDLAGVGAEDVRLYGRLFGPIRIAYKLDDRLGASVARLLSGFDDRFSQLPWTTPLGGHLVVTAKKPGPAD
jgi:SAM-dependent methyltransferase